MKFAWMARSVSLDTSRSISALPASASSRRALAVSGGSGFEASKTESLKEIRDAIELKQTGKCKRVVVAGCLVQRHKTKLLSEAPGIDRLVGVFDREHIVEAVRGKENPRQGHGHFLGKYHDLSNELVKAHGSAVGLAHVIAQFISPTSSRYLRIFL